METKRALITGASSGLGVALAEELAGRGYDLILTARSEAPMQVLADRLRTQHRVTVTVAVADLAEPGSAARLVALLDGQGLNPSLLIANAGFGLSALFVDHAPAKLTAMLQLNMVSLAELAQAYGARMQQAGRGHILLVASVAAFQAVPLLAAYAATKAFVLALGEALHLELAPKVGVTVLCPGFMETGFGAVSGFTPDAMTRRTALPAARVARIGVAALLRGEPVVVAGWMNRLIVAASRLIPHSAHGGGAHRLSRGRWWAAVAAASEGAVAGLARPLLPVAGADHVMRAGPAQDAQQRGHPEDRKDAVPVSSKPAHVMCLSKPGREDRKGERQQSEQRLLLR